MLALSQGLLEDAQVELEAALTAARERREASVEAAALGALGRRAVLVDAQDALAHCDAAAAAACRVGDPILLADALMMECGACERAADLERADVLAGAALALYRVAGDPTGVGTALSVQGWYAMVHGRLEEAEQRLDESLELLRRHGDDRALVEPVVDQAWLMLARGRRDAARSGFLDCLALARHTGDQFNTAEALAGLSTLAAEEARWSDAARLAGASAALHKRIGAPAWESVTAIHEDALARAREALGEVRYSADFAIGQEQSPEEAVGPLDAGPASTSPLTA
jgi:tetratricopeptide (TPR) repeat protein